MWIHRLDPEIVNLFSLSIRWYGMMYVIGFILGTQIFLYLSRQGFLQLSKKEVDSFATSMLLGMLVGARLTYVFIYNWDYHRGHPWELFSVWKGGLSFHGALIGFIVVMLIWARKKRIPMYQLCDSLALAGCLGVGFGRLGNFINGELYGRMTGGDWGVIFPGGGPYPRHPSQLYEAFFEGYLLFILLWLLKAQVRTYGAISAAFLLGYGIFRYLIEFFREADPQMGYYFNGTTTMGQVLCSLMILGGIGLYFHAKRLGHPIQKSS